MACCYISFQVELWKYWTPTRLEDVQCTKKRWQYKVWMCIITLYYICNDLYACALQDTQPEKCLKFDVNILQMDPLNTNSFHKRCHSQSSNWQPRIKFKNFLGLFRSFSRTCYSVCRVWEKFSVLKDKVVLIPLCMQKHFGKVIFKDFP